MAGAMTRDSEGAFSGRLTQITCRFVQDELERTYRIEKTESARLWMRFGVLGSIVLWLLAGLLFYLRPPAHTVGAMVDTSTSFSAGLLIVFLFTYSKPSFATMQWVGAIANACAGFLLIFTTLRDGVFDIYGAAAIMLCTVFAFNFLGLRFVMALTTVTPYAILYASVAFAHLSLPHALVGTYLVFACVGMSGLAARLFEGTTRREFLQRRLIEAQRREIEKERAKSERLLANMLPKRIAARLKERDEVIADLHPDVTVLFADIVGFTPMSEKLEPAEVVSLLDTLFADFDRIAERLGLEKIKTIGDAYMVAAGVPEPRSDHADVVLAMAIEMQRSVIGFARSTGRSLSLRIGIHSGPAVAGVIGRRKRAYDLWGDTVNTASRMESHGMPGMIQMSRAAYGRLRERVPPATPRSVEIKGKGVMETFLIDPEKGGADS